MCTTDHQIHPTALQEYTRTRKGRLCKQCRKSSKLTRKASVEFAKNKRMSLSIFILCIPGVPIMLTMWDTRCMQLVNCLENIEHLFQDTDGDRMKCMLELGSRLHPECLALQLACQKGDSPTVETHFRNIKDIAYHLAKFTRDIITKYSSNQQYRVYFRVLTVIKHILLSFIEILCCFSIQLVSLFLFNPLSRQPVF